MDPTFLTCFLGCRTNQAEIEEIEEKLKKIGFFPFVSKTGSPDVIIFNSCVVTQKAEKETANFIRKLRKQYPQSFIVVLGCGSEAFKRDLASLPPADLFLGNQEREKIVEILKNKFSPQAPCQAISTSKYFQSGRALIKIQEGCDYNCTYCITKILRGKSKSESPDKIIKKINSLPKNIKEIILTGTAIDLWGKDLKPPKNLNYLLSEILKKTKIPKITLSSLNPNFLNKKLAKLIAQKQRISPFLHLSLQSGSKKVLKDMGRNCQFNKLKSLIQLIKQQRKEFVLRADIIVGFPTEEEKDFQETLQLIKQLEIAFVHPFTFSPRPGTLAFEKIKNGFWRDLPKEIKKKRLKFLRSEVEKIRKNTAQKLIGKKIKVLTTFQEKNNWYGLVENSFLAKIKTKKVLKQGELINTKIINYKNNLLEVIF
jgi:threonylcarbamoyladenosine tRNA methylthiotransferase MtaB